MTVTNPPASETPVPQRLTDRVCIVTGAGQGLGRAFAHRLASEGAHVVVADLNGENAGRVAGELSREGLAVGVDVSNEEAVARMVSQTIKRFGAIDVLVNNASIFATLTMRPFEQIPVEEWDRLMAVNVRGPFLCVRAVAPAMKARGYGRIINISSGTIFWGRPNYLHYVTSKAAIVGMTRGLATELGPHGITVNAVAPGSVETEVPRATVTAQDLEKIIGKQAIKRREVPADLVGMIAFLASPESGFITGQTISVNGGESYN